MHISNGQLRVVSYTSHIFPHFCSGDEVFWRVKFLVSSADDTTCIMVSESEATNF